MTIEITPAQTVRIRNELTVVDLPSGESADYGIIPADTLKGILETELGTAELYAGLPAGLSHGFKVDDDVVEFYWDALDAVERGEEIPARSEVRRE